MAFRRRLTGLAGLALICAATAAFARTRPRPPRPPRSTRRRSRSRPKFPFPPASPPPRRCRAKPPRLRRPPRRRRPRRFRSSPRRQSRKRSRRRRRRSKTALSTDPSPTLTPDTAALTARAADRYAAIDAAGGWPTDLVALNSHSKGPAVVDLRRRLAIEGDLDRAAAEGLPSLAWTPTSLRRSSASRRAWACARPESSPARR